MWVYSTTVATSAQATRMSSTASGSTFTRASVAGGDNTQITEISSVTASTSEASPFGTTYQEVTDSTRGEIFDQVGGPNDTIVVTAQTVSRRTEGFSSSETRITTVFDGGVTTASASASTVRTRDSYRSTTAIVGTYAAAVDTTTTHTTTRSVVTTAAGPTTTSAAETFTQTTSTTVTSSANAIDYLTAPSTTLSAPVSLAPVSEAAATEQAWEITVTDWSAGYASQLGSTFTRRTGTLQTTSSALPLTSTSTFTAPGFNTNAGTTYTLTTTLASSTIDTFVPFASVFPATATSTRSLALLTTETTTLTSPLVSSFVATLTGQASDYITTNFSELTLYGFPEPVTINVSPTETATAEFQPTWLGSALNIIYSSRGLGYATSASGDTGTVTTYTGTVTITDVDSDTDISTATVTTTETETVTEFEGGGTYTEACGIPPPNVQTGSLSYIIGATSYTESATTTHNAPSPHTVSVETWRASASTHSTTYTTIEGFSYTFTTTGTITGTISISDVSSFTIENGVSYTFPKFHPQTTAEASVKWSAHAMHPRPGFRHPLELAPAGDLASALSISPSSTIYYPFAATQDDGDGARTPLVATHSTSYQTGSSVWSARWDTSDSRLHWSSGITSTYTTTSDGATVTRTSTDSVATGKASFSALSLATWFAPQSTTVHSAGSRIGGIANKSEHGAALYTPGGFRHHTHQIAGTFSSSYADWIEFGDLGASSNEGYALPTRTESVWSVLQGQTKWKYDTAISITGGTGATSRPVVTLSLNPNL